MDDNEELSLLENVKGHLTVDYAGMKRRRLILLLAYSAILGVISCFLAEEPEEKTALEFILGLPILILGISWCFTDAAERDHRIGRLTKLLLVLVFIVGLPIYLLQTRGLGAFKSFWLTLLLGAAMLACMFAAAFATAYVGHVAGVWELEY